jgi:hypothetical protein
VQETPVSSLPGWESFYVITGTAAGALTGLTFVVISLITDLRARIAAPGVAAFTTPTVVHFCVVLLIAGVLTAPWPALAGAAVVLGLTGLAGLAYSIIVARRLRRITVSRLDWEDWLWYATSPLVAYAALIAAALLLPSRPVPSLFGIGAITLVLLFIGIRNAWDSATYAVVQRSQPQDESEGQPRPAE